MMLAEGNKIGLDSMPLRSVGTAFFQATPDYFKSVSTRRRIALSKTIPSSIMEQ
jgi:hypothetical protein